MIVPPTRVTLVAPNAIARSMRPPYRIRDSTSRPNWSVPSRWPGVSGGASGLSASMVLGGWLTRTGARVIAAIAMASMASPAISVSRRRTALRRRADARVAAYISSSDGLAAHGVLREHRVAEHVPPQHLAPGDPLHLGGVHELGAQRADRRRAQAADQHGGETKGDGERGQEQVVQVPDQARAEAADREHRQVHAEDQDEDDAEPERGHREAQREEDP